MKPSFIQVQIKDEFPDTHHFSYKNKKYPFKFEFFKLSSKYFFNHKEELEKSSFFRNNLSLHQNNSIFETMSYEKIISENLSEYIEDEQLLTLKIPMIYRILKVYKLNQKNDQEMSEKIVTFLFRCLDKFGIAASCLFEFADISLMKNDCLNRLLTDYSNSFDFHFINKSFLQNLYETQSKILRNQEQQENDISIIKSELKKLRNEKNEQQEKINEKDKQINDLVNEVNQLKSEIIQIKKDQNQQNDKIDKQRKYIDNKFNLKVFYECKPNNTDFNGIFNYLQTSFNIRDEVDITHTESSDNPYELFDYRIARTSFQADNLPNSWICFEFKKHCIIPSHYIIRSYWQQRNDHLKTWVIEGSNDGDDWDILDEQKDCSYLNGKSYIHLFPFSKKEFAERTYKYIRIRQTGKTWANRDYLLMDAFELFGKLI